MKKQNVRTLALIVFTFTYLLVGAAVFDKLESENEAKQRETLTLFEDIFRKKYNMTDEDYLILQTVIIRSVPHKAGQQWKFAGAFYFATTVLTTIGYGHSTPTTVGGKGFCIVYALIGIPLGLVMFQSIGERLNKFSAVIIRNVKRVLKFKDVEASETNLIIVVFTLSFIVTMAGAAAFGRFEGWDYFDAVYYCFVTLTTIGFGDYVALQKDSALQKDYGYVVFSLMFILFGLAVVAACMNLLVLRFMTMNTEDERRDEAEAQAAAQGAVRLEGDVITANGSIISGQGPGGQAENSSYDDLTSVCSCTCYGYSNRTPKHRYAVSRSPGKHAHLLPMQPLTSSDTREDIYSTFNDETNSFYHYHMNRKRASI